MIIIVTGWYHAPSFFFAPEDRGRTLLSALVMLPEACGFCTDPDLGTARSG